MLDWLQQLVPPFLGVVAIAYAGLAVRIMRSGRQYANSMISFLMCLFAGFLAGAAFSYGATDAALFGVGRMLSFFSVGFIPIVFYIIYREYTVGTPGTLVVAILSIIPVATTALALTNSMHNFLWVAVETAGGLSVTEVTEHYWYNRAFSPFVYGLLGFAAIALAGRLSSIASAHRKTVSLLLVCGMLPYLVALTTTLTDIGPPEFPFAALVLALLWPFFAYLSEKTRVYEFSPLAYQTLFNHVRDPIFVIDSEQCIICANHAAQELLGGTEKELIGNKLWANLPAARAILERARELDLTQTLRMDTDFTYEVSVGPLSGPRGQNMGMIVVCRDVTQRRMAQMQLADSEHLIRTLIETSSNGILRFKREEPASSHRFRCVFANRSAQNFVGDDDSTLVGLPLGKLEALDPEKLLQHFGGVEPAKTQIRPITARRFFIIDIGQLPSSVSMIFRINHDSQSWRP